MWDVGRNQMILIGARVIPHPTSAIHSRLACVVYETSETSTWLS
jgi:hypothetical protein